MRHRQFHSAAMCLCQSHNNEYRLCINAGKSFTLPVPPAATHTELMRCRFVFLRPSFTSGTTWQQVAAQHADQCLIDSFQHSANARRLLNERTRTSADRLSCHSIILHRSYLETNEWELKYKNTQEHNQSSQTSGNNKLIARRSGQPFENYDSTCDVPIYPVRTAQ
jgi:hypothetical protein